MDGELGLAPRFDDSESSVLLLDDSPMEPLPGYDPGSQVS